MVDSNQNQGPKVTFLGDSKDPVRAETFRGDLPGFSDADLAGSFFDEINDLSWKEVFFSAFEPLANAVNDLTDVTENYGVKTRPQLTYENEEEYLFSFTRGSDLIKPLTAAFRIFAATLFLSFYMLFSPFVVVLFPLIQGIKAGIKEGFLAGLNAFAKAFVVSVFSFPMNLISTIIKGAIELVTTPYTWFIKMPIRAYLTNKASHVDAASDPQSDEQKSNAPDDVPHVPDSLAHNVTAKPTSASTSTATNATSDTAVYASPLKTTKTQRAEKADHPNDQPPSPR